MNQTSFRLQPLKRSRLLLCEKLVLGLLLLAASSGPVRAQWAAITYQGRLDDGMAPATGVYDLRFNLYDAASGGNRWGPSLTSTAIGISNGLFTVALNFGSVFNGDPRWLEIAVRTNGGGGFATLSPRQAILPTPYAIQSANAVTAAGVSGPVSTAQLTGTISSNNIGAGSITTIMLANGAVGSSQLAPRTVTTGALADGAVTAAKVYSVTEWATSTFTNPAPATTTWFGRNLAAVGSDRVLMGTPYHNAVAESVGVAHLFSTDGTLIATFTNPAPAGYDYFGSAVAAVGSDRVLIGAMSDGTDTLREGVAYLFSTEGKMLTTFTNPTPANSDFFGGGVGGVGNDRVLIGAPLDDTGAIDAGAAYLFSTNGTLLTTFTNPTPAVDDSFGWSVTGLGIDRVLVGAASDDTGATNAGAAYLFSTNGTLLTTFTNPTPAVDDWFGGSVAAVGTDRVLIGAFSDDRGATNAGAAYLFSTNGTLITTFTNPTPAVDDWFGGSVAAVGTDRVLIGAHGDNTGAAHAGAVYLFNTNGTLIATFTNPTPATDDYFGASVAAVGNDRVLTSSPNDDTGATNAGAAYLFSFETYAPGLVADGVRPHSVTMASLAEGAVNTAGLADGAVTAVKIGGVLTASQIPDLDASKIASGVLDANRIPALDASKIASGTLDDPRLSPNVALRSGGNSFTGNQSIGSGSLGIGTSNPQGNLHVYGASNPAVLRMQSSAGDGTARLEFFSNPQGSAAEWRPAFIQSVDNGGLTGGLSFVVNGAGSGSGFGEVETMRIVNGRVGIGGGSLPTPFATLTVDGTIGFPNVTTPAMYVYPSGTANPEKPLIVHSPNFAGYGLYYRDDGDRFVMKSSPADATPSLVVDLDSNWIAVGAEVPKPGYEASINGDLVSQTLLVQNSADWAGSGNSVSLTPAGIGFGQATRQMIDLWGGSYGIGVQSGTHYFRTGVGVNDRFAWYQGGTHSDTALDPGAGGAFLMSLDRNYLTMRGGGDEQPYIGGDGAGGDIEIGSRNAAILTVGFWNTGAGTHMNVVAKTFNPTSDRNAKQDFVPVDTAAILEKVLALPMSEWAFKSETQTRHIGPMAQDFHAAFGVGPDDKHIATVDADGVALAAIQGLNRKLEDELKRRDAENAELRKELSAIKALLVKAVQAKE